MPAFETRGGALERSNDKQRPPSGFNASAARAKRRTTPKRCERCSVKHLKCDRPKQGSCGICLAAKEACSFTRLRVEASDYQKYRARLRQSFRQQADSDSASDASYDSFDSLAFQSDSDWSAASETNHIRTVPADGELVLEQQAAYSLSLGSDVPERAGSSNSTAFIAEGNPHFGYEDRHAAHDQPFLRIPSSVEELNAARDARFAKVWTGIDFRKWEWHLDPRTTSSPVLFSLKQAPPSATEPHILLFDDKLRIEALPLSRTAPDLPTLLAQDWTVRGPSGTLVCPPWDQIRDVDATTKTLWPDLDLEEKDFDELRASVATLFAAPVIPFMCEMAVANWQDYNLFYLPELNSDLIKCRLPASSNRYQQSLMLMLAVLSASTYGALGMIFDKGQRVKVGTWELGLHFIKLAWLLMLPKTGEKMTLKRLCFMQMWASVYRPRPDREMHIRVYRAAANDPATHAAIVKETQNTAVDRELYKRWLTGHIASIMNHRLWELFECPYRLRPRLVEMGPLRMLPREDEEGMAHSLESSLFHNRVRREIDIIGERLFDSALVKPMPLMDTPEWTQAHEERRLVGRQFLDEMIEYKTRVLEPRSRWSKRADPLQLNEYKKYQMMRSGRFITTAKLLSSSLTQAGLLELAAETEQLVAAIPKYEPHPAVVSENEKPDRPLMLTRATGGLNIASIVFGSGQGLVDRFGGF